MSSLVNSGTTKVAQCGSTGSIDINRPWQWMHPCGITSLQVGEPRYSWAQHAFAHKHTWTQEQKAASVVESHIILSGVHAWRGWELLIWKSSSNKDKNTFCPSLSTVWWHIWWFVLWSPHSKKDIGLTPGSNRAVFMCWVSTFSLYMPINCPLVWANGVRALHWTLVISRVYILMCAQIVFNRPLWQHSGINV